MPVDRLEDAVDVLEELPGEAALPDSRLAGHGDQAGLPLATRGVEEVLQEPKLVVAAHERRLDALAPVGAAALGNDAEGPVGGHRGELALERLLPGRLEGDGALGGAAGGFADQDDTRRRDRLEARRGVDQVARDHGLAATERGGVDRSFAGQDAGAERKRIISRLVTQVSNGVDEIERGADGPLRVILLGDRRPPDGHHRVPDELLDGPAIPFDDLARDVEVPVEELAHPFRVLAVAAGGEADQVREQDRDQASLGEGRLSGRAPALHRRSVRCRDRTPRHSPGPPDGRRAALGAELGAR